MKFIAKEEWQQMQGEQGFDMINEVLMRVYNRAVEDAIRSIPSVISRLLVSIPARKKLIKDFHERNPSYKDHKEIVAKVVQDVESDNPDMDYDQLLRASEPIINRHIEACTSKLPLEKPTAVNLKGNGVL
jgi:hypothetical protein